MAKMQNPSSFFSGGGTVSGDVELEGRLDLNRIVIGLGAQIVDGASAVGIGAKATGNLHSAAFGKESEATGGDATALGTEAKATNRWNTVAGYDAGSQNNGRNIVLVGRQATATGDNAVAIGEISAADGQNSTAIGRGTKALGDDSAVFGQASIVTGVNSTVIGQGVTVDAANSTSIGTGTSITGDRAVGVGANSTASGDDSIAFGESATANALGATAIGSGATASGVNALAVGTGSTASRDEFFSFGDRNVNLEAGRSFQYTENAGIQTIVNIPVTSDASDGDKQAYSFDIGGETVFQIEGEADGVGGVKNKITKIASSFDFRGASDSAVDIVTGNISIRDADGNEELKIDATSDPPTIDFNNNRVESFGLLNGESLTFKPDAGTQRLTDIPIDAASENSEQSYTFAVGGDDIAKVKAIGNGAGGIKEPQFELLDILNVSGNNIEDGTDVIYNASEAQIEQSILENSSLTYNAGDGLGGGGNVALGSSATFNIGAGSFITANNSSIEVNIGSGIEGDGTDNIRVRGDAVSDGFLSEGTNPHQISVNLGFGLTGDGSNNISVDETTAFDFSSEIRFASGLNANGNIRDGPLTIYDSANNEINQGALANSTVGVQTGNGLVGGDSSLALGNSITLSIPTNAIQTDELDESISPTFTGTHTFSGGITMDSNIDMKTDNTIVNVPLPNNAKEVANKEFVDGVASGLSIKASTRVATDGTSIDLTSTTDPNPVDGVTLSNGDRILLKNQADAVENGIYDAVTATDPSTWVRSSDFNEDPEVESGAFTFIREGTANGSISFTVTTGDPISVDTDEIQFAEFARAGEISEGTSIEINGQTISVDVPSLAGTGIEESANTLRIDSTSIGDGLSGGSGSAIDVLTTDFAGFGLIDDGTNDLRLDTPFSDLSVLVGSPISVGGQLNLGGDITDSGTTIYNTSAGHVPSSILEATDITVSGNDGLSGGTASLGGSLSVGINGNLSLDSDLLALNGEVIWDESEGYIPQSSLENDTVTINGNSVSLGNNVSLSLPDLSPLDVSGNDISDGAATIYDASAGEVPPGILGAAEVTVNTGTGISGGGSPQLGGSGITISLTNTDITINASNGLTGGTTTLGGSINVGISGSLELDTDLKSNSSGSNNVIYDESAGEIATSVLPDPLAATTLRANVIGDNGASVIDFEVSGIKRAELDNNGNLDIEGSLTEGSAL
jgi:hypothetical protein